jgi:hypothetical protein
MIKQTVLTAIMGISIATPALAEQFEVVSDKSTFLSLVEGRELKRLGISLEVTDTGEITGRAFGRDVSGNWQWREGYFCRDLYYGTRDLGPNCQQVAINGETIRFTSDRGEGIYADLRLD